MNYVITIGRQFGSGGRELGRLLAQKLGIQFYDKELLSEAARQSGISPEFFIENDEREPAFLSGLLPFSLGASMVPWYGGASSISDENLYRTQCDIMRHVAKQGPCVIVGRTADYVLRDMDNVVNVFLHADIEDCAKRILQRSDCDSMDKAVAMAKRVNKLRSNYYNFYTDKTWGDAQSYDLTFNTSRMPISDIADIIVHYLERKLGASLSH